MPSWTRTPHARVACETATTTGLVMVLGEITTSTYVDFQDVVRSTVKDIGYIHSEYGFDYETCGTMVAIKAQSLDIARGVDHAQEARSGGSSYDETGAGDQGMMFGYACRETPELMPLPISLAHRMARRLAEVRKSGQLHYLRPDGKTQVTVEYEGDRPVRVHTVVVSSQHDPDVEPERIHDDIVEAVILPSIDRELRLVDPVMHVNPTGRFVTGGPKGDAGLTGRKIIVDTYGGYARHGGGAFSGKDATKVDRSAAYAARWVAKNVVAAGLAERFELAGRLRHRHRPPRLHRSGRLRHGDRPGGRDPGAHQAGLRPAPSGHHRCPRPARADLPPDGRLRALRPARPRPALGAHGQGRPAPRLTVPGGSSHRERWPALTAAPDRAVRTDARPTPPWPRPGSAPPSAPG